jgi:signal transduction histidine kinase
MHFDDRLATVLRLQAPGPALARIQYRQLVDLLGTQPAEARSDTLDAAYERLDELSRTIPAVERAAVIRDKALRLRTPRLIAELARGEAAVADAAIDAARLDPAEWSDLLPALPPAARNRLASRPDLDQALVERLAWQGLSRPGLPPAERAASEVPVAGTEIPGALPDSASIGAIVKRIEAYRKSREVGGPAVPDAPRLPLGEDHVLYVPSEARAFDFATDPSGRIVWADPGVAPMLLGRALASPEGPATVAEALRRRQPIAGQRLTLDGAAAIAGDWRVDAAARFDPLTGRFLGHQGRMRRWPMPANHAQPTRDSEADRIRQLLHELRTPVNAIQGFAEVIQQQLFGPTPHDYRALAATIAGDAARMLAAFEELERLAKLESAAMTLEGGETDLTAIFASTVAQLSAHTGQRGSGFVLAPPAAHCHVALARIEVERLAWRLLATLAGTAGPGEQLALVIEPDAGQCRIAVALPASLASRSDKDLFEAAPGAVPQVIAAGVFGVGFALRLVRAEAAACGGQLIREDGWLIMTLPDLTAVAEGHSQSV